MTRQSSSDWGFVSDFFAHKCETCGTRANVGSYKLSARIGERPVRVSAHLCKKCLESSADLDLLAKTLLTRRGAI